MEPVLKYRNRTDKNKFFKHKNKHDRHMRLYPTTKANYKLYKNIINRNNLIEKHNT